MDTPDFTFQPVPYSQAPDSTYRQVIDNKNDIERLKRRIGLGDGDDVTAPGLIPISVDPPPDQYPGELWFKVLGVIGADEEDLPGVGETEVAE